MIMETREPDGSDYSRRVKTIFDVEPTNRCNARCIMCPRDKTPAQGDMDERTFRQVVKRAKEYGNIEAFVLGGLGEPTVCKDLVKFTGIAADAGIRPSIITNAYLLDRNMSKALVAAGVKNIDASLGGITKETYESVQVGLNFERVYKNVMDFIDVAGSEAFVNIQISPTEQTAREAEEIAAFWRSRGAKFCFIFPFAATRGGALDEQTSQDKKCKTQRLSNIPKGCMNIEELFRPTRRDYETMHARAEYVCYTKDRFTFISWQGNYHPCSNDYEKLNPIGDVFSMSVDEAFMHKARMTPENSALCGGCRMSNGDLPPRGARMYCLAGSHLFGSAVAKIFRKKVCPDLTVHA